MKQPAPPFTCSYSPNIPELLWDLNCTLAITTYQAGKLVFISAASPNDLVQLPRTFNTPMGVAIDGNKLAIASKNQITIFADSPAHASTYPDKPNTYDHLFIPRTVHYTGDIDAHDLVFAKPGLLTVNTRFSCIASIDSDFSFKPYWKPKFITELLPEDRCHLNGLVLEDGMPKYISALGESDKGQGWRENKTSGGIVIDIPSGEIVCRGLGMPHSPRIYKGKLYALLSATGELICIDTATGKYDVVNSFNGFVRGLAICGDYGFIGLSKLREKSSAFADLPIAKKSLFCGIMVVYMPTGAIVGQVKYESSVEEIYDLQILPEMRRPGIMNMTKDTHTRAIVTPDSTFWALTEKPEDAPNSPSSIG